MCVTQLLIFSQKALSFSQGSKYTFMKVDFELHHYISP